jgi:hypothetical protein
MLDLLMWVIEFLLNRAAGMGNGGAGKVGVA